MRSALQLLEVAHDRRVVLPECVTQPPRAANHRQDECHRAADHRPVPSSHTAAYRPNAQTLEDLVRWEALDLYLKGQEEGALDLLAVAHAIAHPRPVSRATP